MRETAFVFESVDLLYYGLHKTTFKIAGSSYIKSYEWIRNKRPTTNPKNEHGNNCFQYSSTVSLNHPNFRNHQEEISKIRSFISRCNWKGIDFPSGREHWKRFEQNNKTIALNILFAPHKRKKIAYKSRYNREHKNQVILLMITDG